MPSKPVFLGARLASLPMRSQERSISTEDGMDCILQEFDDDTGDLSVSFVIDPLCSLLTLCVLLLILSCRSDPGVDFITGAAHSSGVQLSSPAPASNPGAAVHSAQRGHGHTR